MVARARREHLIPLRQHVDRAGGIGHDLLCQPVLEGRDHPIIAIVDDQERAPRLILFLDHHLPNEVRLLNPERVMGCRAATIAPPATIVAAQPDPLSPEAAAGAAGLWGASACPGTYWPHRPGSSGAGSRRGRPNVGISRRAVAAP